MRAAAAATLAGSVALVITLGAGGWWWWWSHPVSQIEDAVRSELLDPESARFFQVKVDRDSGYGCGLVNAKNKLGGYTGKRQFVATTSGKVTLDPEKKAPDLPRDPNEGRVALPTYSTDVYAGLARAQQGLADALARSQQIDAWSAKADEARAENSAFASLVNEKCPK